MKNLKKIIVKIIILVVLPSYLQAQITITYDSSGNLKQKDIQTVTSNPKVDGPFQICQNESFTLTASGGSSYQWNTGATTASVQLIAHSTRDYTVTITASDGCENILVHPLTVSSSSCCVDHPDFDALVALYNSTNGANWANTTNWDPSGLERCDPCRDRWYGVNCSNGRVVSVSLSNNQLNGTIPSEIEGLTKLKGLFLTDNQLRNSLPSTIGNLPELETIYLTNNQLNGALPTTIGNLTQLKYLNLEGNKLSGVIPTAIGDLSQLLVLTLSNNEFSDGLPVSIGQLTNLSRLEVDNNKLTKPIPIEIGNMIGLRQIELNNNQITGNIPSELGNLPLLKTIYLYRNALTGTLPSSLGDAPSLTHLYFHRNQLEGCIPSSYSSFCQIPHSIILSNNIGLEETNFANFCATNSGICVLPCNHSDFTALAALYNATNGSNWTNKTNWDLTGASGCDPCQDNWYGITCKNGRVSGIELANNNLQGNLPTELGKFTYLEMLVLNNNQIIGALPSSVGDLVRLQNLSLNNNQISGALPVELGNLSQLLHLDISNNQLNGNIPPALGNLVNLRNVNLYDNQLNGSIPSELGNLTNLTNLSLNKNQLSGCFPSELATFCQNGTVVNTSLNPQLEEESFGAFCSNNAGACPVPCLHPDFEPLVALYTATNGDNWSKNTNWDITGQISCDPCQGNWYGVSCTNGRVTSISLDNNRLNGTIPPEIGQLTYLKGLLLNDNRLNGNIPLTIGNLTALTHLILDDNQLNGTLPSTLGSLANLKYLELTNNQLSGEIPSSIGNLNQLAILQLGDNQLSGEIPKSIEFLSSLYRLALYQNQLTGNLPTELGKLPSIQLLYLHNNQFSGEIPSTLGNLQQVTDIFLSSNALTGSLPIELSNLTSLNRIYLGNNQLSGCIPDEYTTFCQNGTTINLTNNPLLAETSFTNFCTTNSGKCTSCSHPDFPALAALYQATSGVNWTNNTNWDPTGATNCDPCQDNWYGITCTNGRVTAIDLPANKLIGQLPSEMANLNQLTQLNISNNNINGEIPTFLENLSSLTYLDLSSNQFSGSISSAIGQLNSLTYLSLESNQLNGTIPSTIGNLINLKTLNFSNNLLSSNIPTTLGSLASIEYLNLQSNYLTGSIPIELRQLSNLKFLSFNQNQLTSNIPSTLSQLTSLETLNLSNNKLTGSIPPTIGQLNNLQNLLLNQNQLTGCIPAEFSIFCQNNTAVNLANNAGLSEQNFNNFCNFNYGSCTPSTCYVPTNLQENTITVNSAIIQWTAAPNVNSYQVQYKEQGTTNWLTLTGITTNSFLLNGLSGNTTYDWQVRTNCTNGYYSDYLQETFTTLPSSCRVPTITIESSATPTTIELQWTNVASIYEIQYRIAGTTQWQIISGIIVPTWTLTNLTENSNYEWQVRGKCAEGFYSLWKSDNFTTPSSAPCATPSNLTTNNIAQNSADFSWAASTDPTAFYIVQHRIVGNDSWESWNRLTSNTTSWAQTGLISDTNYEWRISRECTIGNFSDWKSTNFTTNSSTMIVGPDTICANTIQNFQITGIPNASSYTWTLPSGWIGTSTTNTIAVQVGTSHVGTINITANVGSSVITSSKEVVVVDNCSNTVMDFDGIDDFLKIKTGLLDTISDFTIETWFYLDQAPDPVYTILSLGNYESSIFLGMNTSTFRFQITQRGGSEEVVSKINSDIFPSYNAWHHVAITYHSASKTATLYLDGMVTGINTDMLLEPKDLTNTDSLFIGKSTSNTNSFLNGKIDEFRFWSHARSPEQLKTYQNCSPASPKEGLLVHYNFEEGIPNGDNSSRSKVSNNMPTDYPADFSGFSLKESGSNYIKTPSTLIASDCVTSSTVMDFDGIDDYLDIHDHLIDNVTDFTIETWFYYEETPTSHYSIFDLGRDWNARINLRLNPNSFTFKISTWDWDNSRQIGSFIEANSFPCPGSWHHAAISYQSDIKTAKLYLNGVVVGLEDEVLVEPKDLFAKDRLYIGRSHTYQNNTYFKGKIDEFRFWLYARSAEQINATKDIPLTGTESGLQAYYDFEEGTPNGNNTTITQVTSKSPLAIEYNAIIHGMSLTGNNSNFIKASKIVACPNVDENNCELVVLPVMGSANKSGLYHGIDTLYSRAIIPADSSMIFKAGKAIILNPGFHAQAGTTLEISIEACNLSPITADEIVAATRILKEEQHKSFTKTDQLELQISPNPFQTTANIRFYLPEETVAHILITNLHGQLLTEQKIKNNKGWRQTTLDAKELKAGIYLVTLQTASQRITKKVMLLQ